MVGRSKHHRTPLCLGIYGSNTIRRCFSGSRFNSSGEQLTISLIKKMLAEQCLVFDLLSAAQVVSAAFRWPKAIKSFHAKLDNILSSYGKALMKLEAEETQRLPLDYATSGKKLKLVRCNRNL
jgi:hypothetical protein